MITLVRARLRGQVLVLFALSCMAMIAVAALAIDGGRILMEQRALQNGVDGSSLTGALDLGPGAGSAQTSSAIDDTVFSIERTLGVSFSARYGAAGHRLNAGPCAPDACTSATCPPTGPSCGPYNPSNAVTSPCCTDWADNSGAYNLSITTPYSYKGTSEPESFIKVDLTHQLPLLIGGSIYPAIGVHVQAVARNHAIPYAIFAFKHYDNADISTNGTTGMTLNKRMGDNGSASMPPASLSFICNASYGNQYGGDLWEYIGGSAAAINPLSVSEGYCPGPLPTSGNPSLSAFEYAPNVNLPPDPGSGALQGSITISNGSTAMLTPTRSLVPSAPIGPRYSTVNVNGTLVLQPGVYFFEGTANGSGLIVSGSGTVETGDCYLQTLPNCSASLAKTQTCNQPFTLATGGSANFLCTTDYDFGALLIFWPAGAGDVSAKCTNQNPPLSGNYYCTSGGGGKSGTYNLLNLNGGGNLYLTSTPKFHDVSLFVDPNHSTSSWNFTSPASLPASCNTQVCAAQIGLGSNVISIGGGGNISVNGALLAPEDNVSIGGSSAGKGYGQVLAYTISLNGSVGVTENYNPIALAYTPVLVQ